MEEASQTRSSSRFRLWSSYLVFNVIVLISVSSVDLPDAQKSARRWAVALTIISLLFTFLTTYVHFGSPYRSIILNTKFELYIISTLLTLWMILVALVSSPTAGLAVESDGAVYLANMYYFTWAGFINGVVLLASFVEDSFGISVRSSLHTYRANNYNSTNANTNGNANTANNTNDTTTTPNSHLQQIQSPSMAFIYWSSLMVSSIVVLGSSADIYNRTCQVEFDLKPQPLCSRTTFAIVAGSLATQASLIIIVGKLTQFTIPFLLEVSLCAVLFVLYIFELFYATGTDGPGSPLGNLYYFSWISFLLCFGIAKCCYDDYIYALDVAEVEFEEERRRRNVHANLSGSVSANINANGNGNTTTTVPPLTEHDVEDGYGDGDGDGNGERQQQQYSNNNTTAIPSPQLNTNMENDHVKETKNEADVDI